MKYSTVLDRLQNLIGYTPSVGDLAKATNLTNKNLYARRDFDREFKEDEIKNIESFYCISLSSNSNEITLDFYPDVFGSCGTGCIVFDETKDKISVTKDLINNYSASNTYSVISARGSSMAPRIEDNDKLIIQKWNGEQIIDDNVYLFRYNDELFIKRLVKNIDQVICISENPRFEDRVIKNLNDFTIIGRVVGLIRERV